MAETLHEYANSQGVALRVDREAGVLRGVKLIGLESQNGRTYRDAALAAAVGLYESAKVNVNHADDDSSTPRDYRDRLGVVRNVEHRPGEGLFGDLHFNPKHSLAEQLVWDAQHNPSNVGFSHNVLARVSREGQSVVVDEITQVQSVDLVADPAATRGLFEHAALVADPPDDSFWDALTVDRLAERRPDLCAALESEALQTVEQELAQLRAADRLRRNQQRIARVLAEIAPQTAAATRTPQSELGESFYDVLLTIEDDERVGQLIRERVEASTRPPAHDVVDSRQPRSVEQNAAPVAARSIAGGADFARALHDAPV